MTSGPVTLPVGRAADPEPRESAIIIVARWMMGLRLVAISALLLGALLVQTITEEILPIGLLMRVTGLTYALSLIWLALWLIRIPRALHAKLQLAGDLAIFCLLIYVTGGPSSPFAFLFLITVALAAVMFGLRGALIVAGAAFVLYGGNVELITYGIIPGPEVAPALPPPTLSAVSFQVLVTGAGFAIVAMLTSYLAHTTTLAETRLRGEQAARARLFALSADVLRSVDSGVVATDLEGNIVLSNPGADNTLGRQRPLEGGSVADLLPIEGVDWKDVLRRVEGGTPVRLEGTIGGVNVPIGCTVTLLTAEGKPVGTVVHFRDLTEARELGRRERLRERMAAVGEMAAGIAHEIRNPLASISGSAQVLGKVPSLRDNERRLSRIIVEESRRLSGIIESFLGYARPPDPSPAPCDVARLLEDTLTLFGNSSEVTAAHKIETRILPHGHPVTADERQLRQAFYNLARNAIQAMPDGGTMTVEAGPEGSWYVIRWRDQGVGMEPQQVQEVFVPFKAFRQGGTGLGLAVVYSIVSDHGGEIQIDSLVGSGTTITIRLPLEPKS